MEAEWRQSVHFCLSLLQSIFHEWSPLFRESTVSAKRKTLCIVSRGTIKSDFQWAWGRHSWQGAVHCTSIAGVFCQFKDGKTEYRSLVYTHCSVQLVKYTCILNVGRQMYTYRATPIYTLLTWIMLNLHILMECACAWVLKQEHWFSSLILLFGST